jgi:hypothetical protein
MPKLGRTLSLSLRTRWSWERTTILLGFLLTIVGVVGGQFCLTPAIQRATAIESDIAAKRAKMKITRAALAFDDIAKQLSGALFLVKPASADEETGRAVLVELKNRALRHRHDEVRTMISQLGIAGAIEYKPTSDAYEALVNDEDRDFTLATFQATNAYDADLTSKVVNDQNAERVAITALQRSRFVARSESESRGRILVAISFLGSTLLLVATLKASRHDSPAETNAATRAAELLEAALVIARERIEKARGARAAQAASESGGRP